MLQILIIIVFIGISRSSKPFQIDGNSLMANLVRTNQAIIIGSVNSSSKHFIKSLEYLALFKQKYPEIMNKIIKWMEMKQI